MNQIAEQLPQKRTVSRKTIQQTDSLLGQTVHLIHCMLHTSQGYIRNLMIALITANWLAQYFQ